ncbi:DUF4934 domain-containing protein [Draconibacterium sediminis]|uniref:DUF4934 domain-containing protein n=1 Tax=Draconibacterium sediminis TaxID=1544798 RepID=UPI0026EFF29D|nr:DUF4934 domain-containing protein [Draconibacterium sediminis]
MKINKFRQTENRLSTFANWIQSFYSLGTQTSAILFFLMVITACSNNKPEQQKEIYNVQIIDAFNKEDKAQLSEIVDGNIEYIRLETKKEILLGNSPRVFTNDSYIVAVTHRQAYLFDRRTGKFIREIGHYGKDPDGYRNILKAFTFDEKRNQVYTKSWDSKIYATYTLDGTVANEITVQPIEREEDMANNIFSEIITSIVPLNDTCHIGYVWNLNGKEEAKLVVFNNNNPRIKVFPQYKRFDYDINRDGISVFDWNAKFYFLQDQLHFFERFTDTVFTVSMEKLEPEFVLHRGETEEASGSNLTGQKGDVPYLLIDDLFGAERFLFFKIRQPHEKFNGDSSYGFYDKATNTTKLSENNLGIKNDVNSFLPFPFKSVNQNNEVAGLLEAFEVKLWFETNPEAAGKLPDKLKAFRTMEESDNPVVMIAKLKD